MSIILELSFIIFFLFIQFYSCFLVCWMIYSRNLDTLPYYLVRLVWFRVYFTRLSLVLLRQGECVFLTLPAGGASPPSRVVVWHLSVGPLHFMRASWGVPVPCEVSGDYTVVVASLPRGTGETPSLPVAVAWYRPGGGAGMQISLPREKLWVVCLFCDAVRGHDFSAVFVWGRAVIVKKALCLFKLLLFWF